MDRVKQLYKDLFNIGSTTEDKDTEYETETQVDNGNDSSNTG